MNNLVYFKGELKGVQLVKNAKSDKVLHKIQVLVEELIHDSETNQEVLCKNVYYLNKWNDISSSVSLIVGQQFYFVCNLQYKKVESKKAKSIDGNVFTYGIFEFNAVYITASKDEIRNYLLDKCQLN